MEIFKEKNMKKKFLTLALMICFIIPCVFVFGACDANEQSSDGHTHVWSSIWTKTETGHYKVCTIDGCNAKSESAAHNGNPCEVCSYFAHDHVYSSEYENDISHHWQKCTVENCNQTTVIEEHNFVNNKCTVCGKGYVTQVDRIRNLEADYLYYIHPNGDKGSCSITKLPDGKNLMMPVAVDANDSRGYYSDWLCELVDDEWVRYAVNYIVIPNIYVPELRDFVSEETEKIFIPDITGYEDELADDKTVQAMLSKVNEAKQDYPNIEIVYWKDEIINITNTFSYQGTEHSYSIDLMPVINTATAYQMAEAWNSSVNHETDRTSFLPSAFVSVEYKGKTLMDIGSVQQVDLEYYSAQYEGLKDVDVLLADIPFEQTLSWNGPRGFFEDIGFELGDYIVLYDGLDRFSEINRLFYFPTWCDRDEYAVRALNGLQLAEFRCIINEKGEMSRTWWDEDRQQVA